MKVQFFSLPPSMRRSYLKNVSDHFFYEGNLIRLLSHYFGRESRSIVKESMHSGVLRDILSKEGEINGVLSRWKLIFLRSFIRLTKPEIIVETGVAHGSSSAVILDALESNRKGRLYSIDMPVAVTPSGEAEAWVSGYSFKLEDVSTVSRFDQVGWLVPQTLRNRWKLILGDSLAELPKLLQEIGQIDVFLHDSLHLYDHMMKEFEIAWTRLKESGFILSDDIFLKKHSAIHDFSKAHQRKFKSYLQMGVIPKGSMR